MAEKTEACLIFSKKKKKKDNSLYISGLFSYCADLQGKYVS